MSYRNGQNTFVISQKSMAGAVLFCVMEIKMISVIVPYWNAGDWIGRCADSLMNQTGDFEFIFVDDFSTDSPVFDTDDRFILIKNRHSKGVSGARNTGIEAAHGEWITFLDADDEMQPNAFKVFQETIEKDPGAVIHQLNHTRFYTKIKVEALKYANREGKYYIPDLPDAWYGVWNKLFRHDFLDDIRFDESLQYGEDGLFILECLAKGAYIHHGAYRMTAVRHRFDNKESLSHVKKGEDIIRQIRAYEAFLFRQEDVTMRRLMCRMIGDLWHDSRCMNLIGGEDE